MVCRHIVKAIASSAFAAVAISCLAQEPYPSRPITLVVPGQPGTSSDLTARIVGRAIGAQLGQPVIVENRPGAAGAIAMQQVARAKADGYTLVIAVGSSTTVQPAITKVMTYKLKDFAPVSMIGTVPLVMLVSKESGISSVSDLVARAKRAPGKLSYGNGAPMYQLAMELFKLQAGVDIVDIAYKGPVDATKDLIGGLLDVSVESLGSATARIASGKVNAIAIMSTKRHPLLPEVPTMIELSYANYEFNGWTGIMAPAGTPETVLMQLSASIARAVQSEEVKKAYAPLQIDPAFNTPAEFSALLAAETVRFEKIARDAKIEKQ